MNSVEKPQSWEPWRFHEQLRLARYVCDEAEESFPVAAKVNWRIQTREERLELIKTIYSSLAELSEDQRIHYAIEEYHPSEATQLIRSPRKIRHVQRGTCLDLTLLFSGLCLPLRLCPIVVVTRNHAFALVGLERAVGTPLTGDELPLGFGPVADSSLLSKLIEEDLYLPLECTGFAVVRDGTAARPPLTFGEAVEGGRKALNLELRFALDIASARYKHGQSGYPDAEGEPLWSSLRRRWSRWEEARRAEIGFQEQIERNVIDSPALRYFEKFLLEPPWHKTVAELLNQLTRTMEDDEEIRGLQQTLAKIDVTVGYSQILSRLKEALNKPTGAKAAKALQAKISSLEHEAAVMNQAIPPKRLSDEQSARLVHLRKLREALASLQNEIRTPRYKRCFLVLGEPGAGKTHLSTFFQPDLAAPIPTLTGERIPSSDSEWRSLMLWVQPPDAGAASLRENIEGTIRRITGYPWESLEVFQHYLDRKEMELEPPDLVHKDSEKFGVPRLLITLDDFDVLLHRQEGLHKELQDLILATTHLHSLYWVVMIQHTSYPDVARSSDFWTRFAWVPQEPPPGSQSDPTIGAWINLDILNREGKLGIELIETITSEGDSNPLRLDIDRGSPTERDLSNPQIAWTFLNCREDLPVSDLVSLNFIEFVKRFWQVRERHIDSTPLRPEILYRLAGIAAATMVENLGFRPQRKALASAVVAKETGNSDLDDPKMTDTGIKILEVIGLLENIPRRDEYGEVLYLGLRNLFFWCYRIAEYLYPRLAEQILDLTGILPPNTDRHIREGVTEFLLLLADSDTVGDGSGDRDPRDGGPEDGGPEDGGPPRMPRGVVDQLWHDAATSPGSLSTSAWLGAPKANLQTQRVVVEAARRHLPEEEREIFAFLYFLGEASPEALAPKDRIAPLSTLFSQIRAAGLEEYFLHVLAKALGWIESQEELLEVLSCLPGVEVLRRTRDIGDLVAGVAVSLCGRNFAEVLSLLIQYARQESRSIEAIGEPPPPPSAERDEGKYFLREFVFFCTLSLAADETKRNSPAELFEVLEREFWYEPKQLKVTAKVRFEMETQANVVLGYRYRHSREQAKTDYESLIAQLVDSDSGRDQNLAFFLIRHTAVTGGKRGIPFNPVFREFLRDLLLTENKGVQKTIEKFYDDFRVNLENSFDFAALDRQRRKILRRKEPSRERGGVVARRKEGVKRAKRGHSRPCRGGGASHGGPTGKRTRRR